MIENKHFYFKHPVALAINISKLHDKEYFAQMKLHFKSLQEHFVLYIFLVIRYLLKSEKREVEKL